MDSYGEFYENSDVAFQNILIVEVLEIDLFQRHIIKDVHLQGIIVLTKTNITFVLNRDIEKVEIHIVHEVFLKNGQLFFQDGMTNIFVIRSEKDPTTGTLFNF